MPGRAQEALLCKWRERWGAAYGLEAEERILTPTGEASLERFSGAIWASAGADWLQLWRREHTSAPVPWAHGVPRPSPVLPRTDTRNSTDVADGGAWGLNWTVAAVPAGLMAVLTSVHTHLGRKDVKNGKVWAAMQMQNHGGFILGHRCNQGNCETETIPEPFTKGWAGILPACQSCSSQWILTGLRCGPARR